MSNNRTRRSNGDGSLYYNESKKLWICQITYYDYTGQRQRKSFSSHSKIDVIMKKNEFIEKIGKGEVNSKTSETLSSLISEFMEREYVLNIISESAYLRKKHTFSIIQKSDISRIPISDITDVDIDRFLASLVNYSNSVISKVFALTKKGFDIACEKRIIYINPLRKTTVMKPRSVKQDKKVRAFTVDEQIRFLKAIESYTPSKTRVNYKNQWLLELFTGMRMGEINALSIDDIDMKNSLIHIRKTISLDKNSKPVLNKTTKTNAGIRDIPMDKRTKALLEEVLSNYHRNKNHLLFYDSVNKKLITTNQVNTSFARFCKKNNLPFFGQHMLRHTYATRCIEAGVRAEVLMRWLGHKDISVTVNTYFDVFSKLNNDHISKVDKYLEIFDLNEEDYFSYLPEKEKQDKSQTKAIMSEEMSCSSTVFFTVS